MQKGYASLTEAIENSHTPTLQYEGSIKSPSLTYGVSARAIPIPLNKRSNKKSIAQLVLDVSSNYPTRQEIKQKTNCTICFGCIE